MTISWLNGENFLIKTKGATIELGEKPKLGDLKVANFGEYEVGGVQMEYFDQVFKVFAEGMTLAHIKKAKSYSDEELQKLNGIDILLLGVGNEQFTENKIALEAIAQIDPRIVVPMHNGNLEAFAKEEGATSEAIDELKITKTDLPSDQRQTVVLNARG